MKNAGAANIVYGQTIEKLLEKEARLKGFSDEELASAFTRLVSVTHDSRKAFVDLEQAEDLARFRHIQVAQAALALAKAEQGNANSLQRYGIQAVHVTTQADTLRARYTALIQSGGKLDASQKAQYASALAAAQAHDKQASALATLGLVQQRVGGTASQFAKTSEGQWQRLGQDVHQFKVSIGEDLLPGLTTAAESFGEWITKLTESGDAQEEIHRAISDLGSLFHELGDVVTTVGPPLVHATEALGGFVHVAELAAAVLVGRRILATLSGLGESAGAAAAGETAAASSTAIYTAALEANTAALQANTVALGGEAAAIETAAAAAEASGAKAATAGSKWALLSKGLATYLIVNQAIKALPGQHDLGLDFSNSTARDALGANQSPFVKGSEKDDAYQAGIRGASNPISRKELMGPFNFTAVELDQAYKAGQKAATKFGQGVHDELASGRWAGAGTAILTAANAAATDTKTRAAAAKAGQAAIKALRQGIASDRTDIDQLKKDLTAAITQGIQAVNDAVRSAKQNLNTIGQDIASTVSAIIDKPLTDAETRLSNAQDRIAARFDRLTASLQQQSNKLNRQQSQLAQASSVKSLRDLRQEILLPGGHSLSADPEKALAQLERLQKRDPSQALSSYILQFRQATLAVEQGRLGLKTQSIDGRRQALETGVQLKQDALKLSQDVAGAQKLAVQRRIADLTDEFNKGQLTQAQLERRLTNTLVAHGVSRASALRRLGVAGADQLSADLQGLGVQAAAITGGPQRAGNGLLPSIVRPLETLKDTQRQIAAITKQIGEKQVDEQKKTNQLLTKISNQQKAQKFTDSLTRNPGDASKEQKKLTGVQS